MSFSFSVALCTFNGRHFLGPQLDSIASQTRAPDELVICDDGSSDGSIEIAREFARRVSFPVRVDVNEKRLGTTKNFEKCISLCNGTIIALADQDDVWYQSKLEYLETAFQSGEIVAAFSDADLIDERTELTGSRLWQTFGFSSREQTRFSNGDALDVLIRRPVLTGATMAFRREWVSFMRPIPVKQIHDSWISFLLAAAGQFSLIPEPLMQYRRHHEQQIGPGPNLLSLREQAARTWSRSGEFRQEQIERWRELYDALGRDKKNFMFAARARTKIKQKIAHLERRTQLPGSKIARVPDVLHEILNRGYWRFSSGWRSIARDLIVGAAGTTRFSN